MTRNTGKSSEHLFEAYWGQFGKNAYCHRVLDSAAVHGQTGKGLMQDSPCDYLVTHAGNTHYAEVKSCSSLTSFPFSQIEKGQWRTAKQVTAAGGKYLFYVHAIEIDKWFAIPAEVIFSTEKKSLKWEELNRYLFNI